MRRASTNWLKPKSSRNTVRKKLGNTLRCLRQKNRQRSSERRRSFRRPRRENWIRLGRQVYLYLHRSRQLRTLGTSTQPHQCRRRKPPTNPLLPLRPNGIPCEMTDKDGNLLWYGEYTAWGRLKKDERVYKNSHLKRALHKNRLILLLLLRILIPLKLELLTSLLTYLIFIKST